MLVVKMFKLCYAHVCRLIFPAESNRTIFTPKESHLRYLGGKVEEGLAGGAVVQTRQYPGFLIISF